MMRALPILAVAFATGVAAGDRFGAVAALAALPALATARRLRPLVVSTALAFAAGALRLALALSGEAPALPAERTTIVGRVEGLPVPEARRMTLRVRAWQPVRALVRLRVEGGGRALLPGDVVSTEARLHRPRGYKNPGAFDVERALRGRGVEAVGAVMPPRGVRLVARGEPSLLARVAAWRASLGRHLDESLSGDRRALVGAMVLGERGLVTPPVEEAFRRAGITHLLSVSGLHLAALALLTYVALRRLLARVPRLALSVSVRALAATATIPAGAAYSLLAGADHPVVRSTIVAAALLGAVIAARPPDGASALALAALAILALDPVALFDPSLQLSFAACVGLMLAPRISGKGPARGLARMALMTGAASLATAPLVAIHFGVLPVTGGVANLVCVPWTTAVLLPASLAGTLLLPFWPGAAAPLLAVAGAASDVLVQAARLFSDAPAAVIAVGRPTAIEAVLAWIAAALLLRGRLRLAAIAAAALALVVGAGAAARAWRSGATVTFVDVGQGDAILVELPRGRTLLVDGGGSFDGGPEVGEAALLPLLRARRVARIDVMALSHPHPDHFGGLIAAARRFPVGELWTSGEPSDHPGYRALLGALEAQGVQPRPPRRWAIGDALVEPLHPSPSWAPALSTNDNSLVLRVSVGARSVLLTGDLEAEGEILLAAERPRADVLKVPHHGSRTSSTDELLVAVRPRLAVASLGADNRFGFPHAEVIDRYARGGVPLLRTDQHGAVIVRLGRNAASVETVAQGGVARW
ncbi:MAG: DNA internalization-related competence protein ComEC/Rec2 [Myxococcota bacterium]